MAVVPTAAPGLCPCSHLVLNELGGSLDRARRPHRGEGEGPQPWPRRWESSRNGSRLLGRDPSHQCRPSTFLPTISLTRARRIQRFLSQPFHVAEAFTGTPGRYVKLEDTIESFERVANGEFDHLPEQAF